MGYKALVRAIESHHCQDRLLKAEQANSREFDIRAIEGSETPSERVQQTKNVHEPVHCGKSV